MELTSTTDLQAAIVAAMHALTPTFEHERSEGWKYTPSDRERGRPLLAGDALRSFDLAWGPALPTFLWYGNGEAYASDLRITTSYRGVPPELLEHTIARDAIDLRRMFAQLPEPTTPGLPHVEARGLGDIDVDDQANAVVSHLFRVHWAQDID